MRQFELATIMGLTFDGRRELDNGYVMHRYSFGINKYTTEYLPTDEAVEDAVACEFFSEFQEMMEDYRFRNL